MSNPYKDFYDRWQVRNTIETAGEDIGVSTVELPMLLGPDFNQGYETCIFHEYGSRVIDRYGTKESAEDGHGEIVEKIEKGLFSFEGDRKQIELLRDDE